MCIHNGGSVFLVYQPHTINSPFFYFPSDLFHLTSKTLFTAKISFFLNTFASLFSSASVSACATAIPGRLCILSSFPHLLEKQISQQSSVKAKEISVTKCRHSLEWLLLSFIELYGFFNMSIFRENLPRFSVANIH